MTNSFPNKRIRSIKKGHSGRNSSALHISCSWLCKCATAENSYLNICRKRMRSNQGRTGDRHLDLAEAILQQRGFYSCFWDNSGKIVWLQLFPEQRIFFVSHLTCFPGITSWQQDRDCDPDPMLNEKTHCKVIPSSDGPGSTLPLFICKTGHPESVTMFFSQAQSDSSSVDLSTNPVAGITLTSPCHPTFSKWLLTKERRLWL